MVRCARKRCTVSVFFVVIMLVAYAVLTTTLLVEDGLKDAGMFSRTSDGEDADVLGGEPVKVNGNANERVGNDHIQTGDDNNHKPSDKPSDRRLDRPVQDVSDAIKERKSGVVGRDRANNVDSHSDQMQSKAVDKGDCEWVNFTVSGPPYFLTAVFFVRIYEADKSELKSENIRQWLTYLRYAGVEHVYLYDLWYLPGEEQREELDVFIREGFLTYTERHDLTPFIRDISLITSYQTCIDTYGNDTKWQVAIDIDEYPFSPTDTSPGFLYRFVQKYSLDNPHVSEITMANFLYLGQKDSTKELLIEKLWRHTHGPGNPLVKPIYKPVDIKGAQVHHNYLLRGKSQTAPHNALRMNHYWGARLQNWGPDTEEILAKTEEDRGMEPIVAAFKNCEPYVRRYLL